MDIKQFTDMKRFEDIMANWAAATGLATVAVGLDGKYRSRCYTFTDFCIKLPRGSSEGCARCEKCDKEGQGVYHCHAGLIDFGIPLEIEGEKVGSVIGGQVLPAEPDEEKFRQVAREIGVNENQYIEALHKVNVRTEEAIHASANLLGEVRADYHEDNRAEGAAEQAEDSGTECQHRSGKGRERRRRLCSGGKGSGQAFRKKQRGE